MRKALSYLAALVVSIGASGAWAADRAVVGMEWGFGPIVRKVPGAARFDSQSTLYWKASDDFTLGVFRGDGTWAQQSSQMEEVAGGPTVWKLRKTGQIQTTGIRLLKTLPMMNLVSVGLDLGTAQFTQQSVGVSQDNGVAMTAGRDVNNNGAIDAPYVDGYGRTVTETAALFGLDDGSGGGIAGDGIIQAGEDTPFAMTAPLLGVAGRMSLLQASNKTITTEFALTGSWRYVVFPVPVAAMGSLKDREVGANGTVGISPVGPIRSYHNLVISLGANIWF